MSPDWKERCVCFISGASPPALLHFQASEGDSEQVELPGLAHYSSSSMGLSCFKSWKHDSTGHKGNRDVLASPGSYFFLSNSGGQGDEWLKSLNKGVWIPFTGVFGQRLEETVLYERRYGVRGVPLVVEQCVGFMRERGLQEVGLFRQPGRASLVRELQEAFDAGERPTFDGNTDVHTVASLLKLYLRQLPEPPVPHERYQDFLLCGQRLLSDRPLGLSQLRLLLHELPVVNFNLLDFVCQFLNEVQSYSGRNRMSCQNLATVFGPNILRAKAEDPQSIMGGAALVQVLMSELIREHPSLFSKIPPSFSARPAAGLQASPLALRQPHLRPAPCLRQLSLPLISEGRWEATAAAASGMRAGGSDPSAGQRWRLGHRHTSSQPENCFPSPAPAPPRRQPPQPGCSSAHSPVGAARAWPGPAGAELWSSPEVRPRGGALPAAATGGDSEALEDSTPSAYDNLDREDAVAAAAAAAACSELCEEAGQTVDSASSWSSCEFLPLDKSGGEVGGAGPGSPSKARPGSGHAAHEENRQVQETEAEVSVHQGPSPSPASAPASPLSSGSSEVFLPSAPPDLQEVQAPSEAGGGGARSLLAELQEQMVQQRAQYQDRIHRLERCNEALERQVAALRLSLEQQKRSFSVAEVKIQNMERAKADADRRNASLQREMQLHLQKHADNPGRGRGGPRRKRTLQSL